MVTASECELLDDDLAAMAELIGSPMKFVIFVVTFVTAFVVVVMEALASLTFPIPRMNSSKVIVAMFVVIAKFHFKISSYPSILVKYEN